MTFNYDAIEQAALPLVGGVVQAQRLVVPSQAVAGLVDYRHACRLAWKLRANKRLTKRAVADAAGLHYSHCTDYFSVQPTRRELPARCIAAVERVLGNTVISQYLATAAHLTVLEELQVMQHQRPTLRRAA